jgi:hypothetical protein
VLVWATQVPTRACNASTGLWTALNLTLWTFGLSTYYDAQTTLCTVVLQMILKRDWNDITKESLRSIRARDSQLSWSALSQDSQDQKR